MWPRRGRGGNQKGGERAGWETRVTDLRRTKEGCPFQPYLGRRPRAGSPPDFPRDLCWVSLAKGIDQPGGAIVALWLPSFFFLGFFVVRRFRALGACSRDPSWRRQRLSCSDYTGVSPSLRRVMADCCRGSFSWEPFFWLHSWFCADAERLAGQWFANRDRWGRLHRSCCACLPACEGPTLPRNRGGEKKGNLENLWFTELAHFCGLLFF